MKTIKSKNYITQYIFCTYVLFGILLFVLGGITTILLHGTPWAMRWLTVLTAWTTIYVLLLMFKKLYPDSTIKSFFKKVFRYRLNFSLLATTTIIQIIIFISSVDMISIQKGIVNKHLFDYSFLNVMSALFFTMIQGPTGEESGWRGYLLPAIVKRTGVVNGSLIVSVVWSFWHAPIWFLGTGYSGVVLVKYIIVFIICITSLGFVIGISYHHCKNLFIPIWIHFLFNFLGEIYIGSMVDLVTWYATLYFIMAVGFYIWHKSNCKKNAQSAIMHSELNNNKSHKYWGVT